MRAIYLLPASVLSFLGGISLTTSRRGLSMLPPAPGSPLPGVPLAAWRRFVTLMVVAPRGETTPRGRHGCFGMDERSLADVGFVGNPRKTTVGSETGVWAGEWTPPLTREKFLASTPAQYEAFSRSMRGLAGRVAPLVGRVVGGRRASLSGLLGVAHLAGAAGAASWAADPAVRKRFADTTERFAKTNGVF